MKRLKRTLPQLPALNLGKAYRNCDELPLNRFIDCVTGDSLRPLVKWGYLSNIEDIWEDIFSEYSTLIKDTKNSMVLRLAISITTNENKLFIIHNMIAFLTHTYDETVAKKLSSYGLAQVFTPEDKEAYQEQLISVYNRAKSYQVRIDQSKAQLKALQSDEKPPTKSDYFSLITALSGEIGYEIKSAEKSVSEFIAILNHVKEKNKTTDNGKQRGNQ